MVVHKPASQVMVAMATAAGGGMANSFAVAS